MGLTFTRYSFSVALEASITFAYVLLNSCLAFPNQIILQVFAHFLLFYLKCLFLTPSNISRIP